jgi:hypothetical protein
VSAARRVVNAAGPVGLVVVVGAIVVVVGASGVVSDGFPLVLLASAHAATNIAAASPPRNCCQLGIRHWSRPVVSRRSGTLGSVTSS